MVKMGSVVYKGLLVGKGTYEEMEELESSKIESNDPTAAHEKKKQKKCTTGQKRFESDETNGNDKKKRKKENSEKGKERNSKKEGRQRKAKEDKKEKKKGSIITVVSPPTISALASPRSPSFFESPLRSPASASLLSLPSSPSLLSIPSSPSLLSMPSSPLISNTSPPSLPPPVFEDTCISASTEQLPSSEQILPSSSSSESPLSVLSAIEDLKKQVDRMENNQYTIINYLHYLQYQQNCNFTPAFGAPPPIPTVPPFQMPATTIYQMQSTELPTVSTTLAVSTAATMPTSSPFSPLPINANSKNLLPSSQIERAKLLSTESVLEKYHNMRNESKAPTLAWKLAREAIFGDNVLRQCTPVGNRELPALPIVELTELKKTMHSQFPQYHNSPHEFESLWKKCVESIQQGCKRLRLPGYSKN